MIDVLVFVDGVGGVVGVVVCVGFCFLVMYCYDVDCGMVW